MSADVTVSKPDVCVNENVLLKHLSASFQKLIPYEHRLKINGIVSYSIDNDREQFVKINLSLDKSSHIDTNELCPNSNYAYCPDVNAKSSDIQTLSCVPTSVYSLDDCNNSPPVIPSTSQKRTYICTPAKASRQCTEFTGHESKCDGDQGSAHDTKRDRRKCRRPKRQNQEVGDQVFDTEAANSSQLLGKLKYARIDPGDEVETSGTSPTSECDQGSQVPKVDSVLTQGHDKLSAGAPPSSIPGPVSVSSQQVISIRSSVSLQNVNVSAPTPSTPRCSLSTKSIGMNDLGDLCGVVPIGALIGRDVSAIESNIANKLITSNVGGSIILNNVDLSGHVSVGSPPTNPSVMINSTLAAAVAAAIANSSTSQSLGSVGVTTQLDPPSITIPHSSPSLALTSPTGEFLGTIPIGGTVSNDRLFNSSNQVQVSSAVGTSYSLATSTSATASNALTWFKNASQPVDTRITLQTTMSNGLPGNTVALLQSLASHQTTNQYTNSGILTKQAASSSASVCPTLALIGTLGLSSSQSSTMATSISSSDSSHCTSNSNSSLPSNSNTSAALIAALLRGISASKPISADSVESQNQELLSNSTTPFSIVANNRSINSSDSTLGTLTNILGTKALNPSAAVFNITGGDSANVIGSSAAQNRLINMPPSSQTNGSSVNQRNSIMLSYPRSVGEMNLVIAPTSSTNITQQTMSSLSAFPAAFSLHGLSNTQNQGITLTSPLLLRAPSTSTSTTSTTSMCSNSVPLVDKAQPIKQTTATLPQSVASSNKTASTISSTKPTAGTDSTESTIDRILQTIKGCMNARSREASGKAKIQPRKSDTNQCVVDSSSSRPLSSRINSMKESEDDAQKSGIGSPARLPLPPLAKDSGEASSDHLSFALGSKVYRCRYCGKTFNRKFCRERHERLHTGIKPYTCEMCNEKFIRLEDKKRHVRSLQHYLMGRNALKTSGAAQVVAERVAIPADPSATLPLLTQTLQSGQSDGLDPGAAADQPMIVQGDVSSSEKDEDDKSSLTISNHDENPDCDAGTDEMDISSQVLHHQGSITLDQSDDLLSKIRSELNPSQGLRVRSRAALRETQFKSVVIVNSDEANRVKISTE